MKVTRIATAAVLGATLTLCAGTPADAAPAAKRQTVTIVAKMSAPATVTSSGNGVIQQKERTGTWTRTFTKKRFTYYSVITSISGDDDSARVTCKIKLNGRTIRSKTATGGYTSVSCDYSTH